MTLILNLGLKSPSPPPLWRPLTPPIPVSEIQLLKPKNQGKTPWVDQSGADCPGFPVLGAGDAPPPKLDPGASKCAPGKFHLLSWPFEQILGSAAPSFPRGRKRHMNIWQINNFCVTPVTNPPGRVPDILPAGYPDEHAYIPWVPHTAHKLLTPGHRSGDPWPPGWEVPPTRAVTGKICLCLCAFSFPESPHPCKNRTHTAHVFATQGPRGHTPELGLREAKPALRIS